MYLKTVFEMEEDGVTPLRARIVERLGHSGPTVSQTVARMERDGLVHVGRDRRVELSAEGRARATDVMRKHRLAERLLLDVIGMDWTEVHDEACRWEHVMSQHVTQRLEQILDNTRVDPFGNPVPGPHYQIPSGQLSVAETVDLYGPQQQARIERIGEPVQAERSLLSAFAAQGIGVGSVVSIVPEGEDVLVSSADSASSVRLAGHLALHLFVAAK